MARNSGIAWCDDTWNPVRGCSRESPGCGGANHQGGCYAEKMAARFSDLGQWGHGFAERTPHGGRWTGKVALIPEMLDVPLRWRRPRKIFVNSTSDLFHENLPWSDIDRVMDVIERCPQHVCQILTKRSGIMKAWALARCGDGGQLPPNAWFGVSIESADYKFRIDDLRDVPAAVRFLSIEPQIADVGELDLRGIAWAIVGGESGTNARPFDIAWARSIRDQCKTAGVSFFMKQAGARPFDSDSDLPWDDWKYRDRAGADPAEWPSDIRVQDFPP